MFQATQTGMAARLDTAVTDALFAAAQGLTTFLTAGGLYSPEENRLKATSFPSIKKDSMTSTYLHLKWAGVIIISYY